MSGRRVDDWVADLHEALSVAPSAHFENRVRAQVTHAAPSRHSMVAAGPVVVLVAAVSVIAVVTATSWVRNVSSGMPSIAAVGHSHPTMPATTLSGAPAAREAAPSRRTIRRTPASSADAGASPSGVFEVLVPPDQAIALRRLLAAMASGRSVVPVATAMADAETGELLEPEPIGIARLPEIAPIGARDTARGREQ
jgi:hypothetical protein